MSNTVELNLIAKDQMSGVVRGAAGAVSGLLGQIAALAGVGGMGALFTGAVKEGIGFQKMLEDSRISIAGVVGALQTYRDANGDVLTGEAKWRAALSDSAAVQEKLRTAALTTTATYQEMVEAFATGVGPMSRAGIALDDTAEATQRLTQVAAAASLPMAQLAIEMRQFFAGDEMRSRLLQTLQITKEQIEEHKKAGDMMEFLREKTESYARAAQAATTSMTGQWSNLKDAIQQTLGIGMEPLFEKMKSALGSISEQFVSFGQDSKGNLTAQFSPEIIARIESFAETLGTALDRFKEMVPAVIDFGLALAQHVSKAIDLLSKLPLKQIVETLTDIIKLTDGWGLALIGVIKMSGGMGAMQAAFAKFPAYLHASSLALDGMALRINAATGASIGLSQAMAGIGAGLAAGGALWGITKIIEGLHVASDLLDEWKLANAAVSGEGKAIEAQLLRFQGAFDARIGPETMAQRGTSEAIAGTLAIVRKELTETGKVSEETRGLYLGLLKDIKATNPDFEDSPITRGVANLSAEVVEARKKWEEFAGKVNDKYLLSSLDGMAKKFQETKNAIRDATAEAKTLASAAGLDPSGTLRKIAETGWRDFAKAFKAVPAEIVGTWDSELKKLPDTVRTYAAIARDEVDGMFFEEDSVGAAMKAGWLSITAALPSAAESAAQALRDVWDSAGRAFNDLFYNVITGHLDDLGDVFRGFADSMASTFSNLVTAMVQRWVAGTQTIADGMRSLNKSMTSEGGGLSWQGGAMAAGTGYGIGSMIGPGGTGNQVGGAVGALAGAYLGAKLGTMGGPIGMLVGAILGAVIGGIFNKNTEKKFSVYTARLVDVAANDQIGRSIQNSRDNIIGMMGDLAALTGGSVKDATDQTRKVINDWLRTRRYEVHAGSQEDIDKDFERLLGEVVPSEMLKQLFGFSVKPYEPTTELPGIRGVGNFHMGTIDEGKEGPLFKMLETLGFARDRIVEIGQQIDARPAEEFIQWLNRLVGVAATSKKLFAEMGKSFADLDAEWSEKEKAGAKGAFTERAGEIADAFAAIENFSGDDQLKRMEEAQQSAAEFWNDVLDYVAQLRAAMNQMSAGIQDQRQKMRDFLNPLGADETASNAWGEVQGVWGKLANATDPAEVEKAVAEAQAAIDKVFAVMAERINRGKALIEKLTGLSDRISSMREDLAFDELLRTDPLRAWGKQMTDIQTQIADASRMSGLAQIEALEQVGATAEQVFAGIEQFLSDIASTSASIEKSIEQQKWELQTGELDAPGQASAIAQRIHDLQEQLKVATSPAEIQAITSEIQSLTNRYVGTFGKDDPRRQEAIDWATEQLDRAGGLAQEALALLGAQAESFADQLEGTITTVTGILETNISDAATTIGQLSHTLGELDRVMRETMERLGDSILETGEPIRQALETATLHFTTSVDAASGAIGGPGGGGGGGGGRTPLVDAANLGASNLVSFAAEVAAATERLRALKPGSGTTTEQQTVRATSGQQSSSRVTAAEVIPIVRRYASQSSSRVG
ncbi:MAG: glycine zipper domain-containing protein [Thermoanaerobaculia bacterium]|nr:glycine zipper domain-containing protein [Thermoanaerobaculia bacterium]